MCSGECAPARGAPTRGGCWQDSSGKAVRVRVVERACKVSPPVIDGGPVVGYILAASGIVVGEWQHSSSRQHFCGWQRSDGPQRWRVGLERCGRVLGVVEKILGCMLKKKKKTYGVWRDLNRVRMYDQRETLVSCNGD